MQAAKRALAWIDVTSTRSQTRCTSYAYFVFPYMQLICYCINFTVSNFGSSNGGILFRIPANFSHFPYKRMSYHLDKSTPFLQLVSHVKVESTSFSAILTARRMYCCYYCSLLFVHFREIKMYYDMHGWEYRTNRFTCNNENWLVSRDFSGQILLWHW